MNLHIDALFTVCLLRTLLINFSFVIHKPPDREENIKLSQQLLRICSYTSMQKRVYTGLDSNNYSADEIFPCSLNRFSFRY